MIKRLKYIFIPVFAILLMSHNVNAVTAVYDMSNYELVAFSRSNSIKCYYSDNSTTTDGICNSTVAKRIIGFNLSPTYPNGFSFKKDDIIEFDLSFYSPDQPGNLSSFGIVRLFSNSNFFNIIDYSVTQDTLKNSDSITYLFPDVDNYITYNNFIGVINYHVVVQLTDDFNGNFGVTETTRIPFITHTFHDDNSGNVLMFLSNFSIYRKSDSHPVNAEQEQKTQDAADNSETAGDTSTSDATSATSSLLSVIGSGIGAITSATPSNCKINGNMGNLNMGQIDLCANPVPTFVAVIGSFIAVALVLPLVIILFNRFISIIRSFQS